MLSDFNQQTRQVGKFVYDLALVRVGATKFEPPPIAPKPPLTLLASLGFELQLISCRLLSIYGDNFKKVGFYLYTFEIYFFAIRFKLICTP